MHQFTKQTSETFFVYGGITNVIATGDDIDIAGSSVVAVDNAGEDVTLTILSTVTFAIYDTTKTKVRVLGAGTEDLSPYKITFNIATLAGELYEVDIFMSIDNI